MMDSSPNEELAPTTPAENGYAAPGSPVVPDHQATGAVASERKEVLQRFWEAVKRLPAYVRLVAAMAKDPDVPVTVKGILGAGSAYVVSPVDLVPGVIPVAGQLDDLYVLLTAIQQSLKRMPEEVANRHLSEAGVSRSDIDDDLKSLRDLVRYAIVKSVVFGGKTLGRISRAAVRFAQQQRRRQRPAG